MICGPALPAFIFMKKKDIITGRVIRCDFPNIGIINTPDGEVRIKNALPGQEVMVRILKKRKGHFEGDLIQVSAYAPGENPQSACPHFGDCGGCLYSAKTYEDELKIKEGQLRRLLSPVMGEGLFNKLYAGTAGSPADSGYRNKMEFSFGDAYKGGPLALGMHKRGAFYDIVTVDECRLVDKDVRLLLRATLDFFTQRATPFYNKNNHRGYLRHLLVRKAFFTGEILLSLITAPGMDSALLREWADTVSALTLTGSLAGILHTENDRIGDVVEDGGTVVLKGRDFFYESLLGLDFKITPFSFFQTNSRGSELLYETVASLVPESGVVYDLYCGTGTIAQIVSKKAKQVLGVEIVPEAVSAAGENAEKNGITNCSFIAGDVLRVLDEIEEKPDFIILDPPREGVHPKALPKILSYGVREIIYVSCKPTSLARDLAVMMEAGYEPTFIKLHDMFPRTANFETVISLRKDVP